jgi:pSer/pThr/pTyr-binding forkhead associated (FHA) protein
MKARMRVVSGPLAGQTIEVTTRLLVGREQDCDLRLPCEFLSRHHCALLLDDCTLRIRDLGSKNGTFVNGRRIANREVILLHEDLVAVGATQLLIELFSQSGEPINPPTSSSAELKGTGVFDTGTVEDGVAVRAPPAEKSKEGPRPAV